jgi:tetratricopeptide (TPR) repeat protein
MKTRPVKFFTALTLSLLIFGARPSSADEYDQGSALYSAGNFAGAKAHLIKATQTKPKSWKAHYQLANTYVQLKDSAKAKLSYQKCLANNPPADIKANCTTALTYIASNPSLAAPVAATPPVAPRQVQMIAPKQSSTPEPSAGGESEPAVNPELAARRARIMKEAEEDLTKLKAQEKERHDELEANANQRYRLPDGTVKPMLSTQEEADFQKELEQKASVIRERAKRRAAELR